MTRLSNVLMILALTDLMVLALAACAPRDPSAGAADEFFATVNAEVEAQQPTLSALSATRAALMTQAALPTPTVTPLAGVEILTGDDGLATTLIWNVTGWGPGASGTNRELPTTTEAHHYLFQGEVGKEAAIHVTPLGADSSLRVVLLDPGGAPLGEATAQGTDQVAEIRLFLPTSGIYHIRVSALAPGSRYGLGVIVFSQ